MPILRDLGPQILKATGEAHLDVIPFSQSSGNIVMALRGARHSYFAKIFARDKPGGLSANDRYRREKLILTAPWQVRIPVPIITFDTPRVIVMREVVGTGFQNFLDEGRPLTSISAVGHWIAGFHRSADTLPRATNLWNVLKKCPEFTTFQKFDVLQRRLSDYPVTEFVLSKGDCALSNFKFTFDGVVGLDFEGTAPRPLEYDLVGLIEGIEPLVGQPRRDTVSILVDAYNAERPLLDPNATKQVVELLVTVRDKLIEAKMGAAA